MNSTWIFSITAVTVFVVGVVSVVVVKTDVTPNWKKIGKVLIWLIGILIFRLVFWGMIKYYWQDISWPAIIQRGQSTKSWVFHYDLMPGEVTKDGHTESTFNAKINDDGVLFLVDLYDDQGVLVSDLCLKRDGNKLVGIMKNHKDGDTGTCYLTADGVGWVGQIIWSGYSPITCTLKK
jgi:hypothetical protein